MDRYQARIVLLKVSFAFLGLLSWASSSFILATRPKGELIEATPITEPLVRIARFPASFSTPSTAAAVPSVIKMESVEVNCFTNPTVGLQTTDARWIRLTGRECQQEALASSVVIENLSNGYLATVFESRPGRFTTDFIPLQKGRNEITFRFKSKNSSDKNIAFVRH